MNRDVKVKLLVVGDSGVGKSQLVTVLTQDKAKTNQSKWTIGANTEVAIHIYKECSVITLSKFAFGIPNEEATFFIELWDISGNQAHKNSRNVYYKDFHGLICVHDLTNRKSLNNLVFWSEEVLEGDAESGIRNVPTLLIGTKQNEVSIGRRSEINERSKRMAEEIGAQTLNLDTSDPKVMAPGGTIKIEMSRFFDRAVERALQCSNSSHSTSGYTNTVTHTTYANNSYSGGFSSNFSSRNRFKAD